ncbi:unnamed protein product [Absidia cylindrospora]
MSSNSADEADFNLKEQDRFLPIANVARIMKKSLPDNAKIAKEAKDVYKNVYPSLSPSSPANILFYIYLYAHLFTNFYLFYFMLLIFNSLLYFLQLAIDANKKRGKLLMVRISYGQCNL